MEQIRTFSDAEKFCKRRLYPAEWADWVLEEVSELVNTFGDGVNVPDDAEVHVLEPSDTPTTLAALRRSQVEWSQIHNFEGKLCWKIVFNDDGYLTIVYGSEGIDTHLDRVAKEYAWNGEEGDDEVASNDNNTEC